MSNLLVELQLFPDADAASLAASARVIQQPALKVNGVIATRELGSLSRKSIRLVLNIEGETPDRAIGLASIMGAWGGCGAR